MDSIKHVQLVVEMVQLVRLQPVRTVLEVAKLLVPIAQVLEQ